jgi:hypothetical protein
MGKIITSYVSLPRHLKVVQRFWRGEAVSPESLRDARMLMAKVTSGTTPVTKDALRAAEHWQRTLLELDAKQLKKQKREAFLTAIGQVMEEGWNKTEFTSYFGHDVPDIQNDGIDCLLGTAEKHGLNAEHLVELSMAYKSSRERPCSFSLASYLSDAVGSLEFIRAGQIVDPSVLIHNLAELSTMYNDPNGFCLGSDKLFPIYAKGINKGFSHDEILTLLNLIREDHSRRLRASLEEIKQHDWTRSPANRTSAITLAYQRHQRYYDAAIKFLVEILTKDNPQLRDFPAFRNEFVSNFDRLFIG